MRTEEKEGEYERIDFDKYKVLKVTYNCFDLLKLPKYIIPQYASFTLYQNFRSQAEKVTTV